MDVSILLGQTMTSVVQDGTGEEACVIFTTSEGKQYMLYHERDCCESVYIESIVGDLSDLVGAPLLMAEESTNSGFGEWGDSFTWTFYKFATAKGYVDIRWHGSSNGYYSESVDFVEVSR